jgi:hypothetical protein
MGVYESSKTSFVLLNIMGKKQSTWKNHVSKLMKRCTGPYKATWHYTTQIIETSLIQAPRQWQTIIQKKW